MHQNANKVLISTLGSGDNSSRVSISKLLAGDSTELLKYIMIVKPGYIEELFKERGLVLTTEEDYLSLPKIMDLKLDEKGIEGSKGFMTFNLRNLLESAIVSKEEIKESKITFVE